MFRSRSSLDPKYRDILEDNILHLARKTRNLDQLLVQLETDGVFNSIELSTIRRYGTRGERSYRMYERILLKNNQAFRSLILNLVTSDNREAIELILQPEIAKILGLVQINGDGRRLRNYIVEPELTPFCIFCVNLILGVSGTALFAGVIFLIYWILVKYF